MLYFIIQIEFLSILIYYYNVLCFIIQEAEQSEFERQEKEHERVQAHESIVDREIRIQQERERELVQLRKSVSFDVTQPEVVLARPETPPLVIHHQAVVMAASPEPELEPVPHVQLESSVSYESAIGSKVHEGESIITRELRAQREREDELRLRYKEMGLDTFLVDRDSSDTPYNAPEPSQPNISKLPAHAKALMKTNQPRGMSRSVSEPLHMSALLEPVRQPTNHVQPVAMHSSVSQDMISHQTIPEEPRSHKVHPLEEPDGFDVAYRFVPQNETPIEREMRLAREREEELRTSRGFSASRESNDVVEITREHSPKTPVVLKKGDEGDGKLMKNFAASRLQFEIEKEKRRELDLRSQGMISTLSSERDQGQVKYVDVIPKASREVKQPPNWRVQNTAQNVIRTISPAPSVDSIDAPSPQPPVEHNGSPVQHQVEHHHERIKSEPAIVRRYSTHTQQLQLQETDKYRARPTPTLAESRIESELREMKDREEELRSV